MSQQKDIKDMDDGNQQYGLEGKNKSTRPAEVDPSNEDHQYLPESNELENPLLPQQRYHAQLAPNYSTEASVRYSQDPEPSHAYTQEREYTESTHIQRPGDNSHDAYILQQAQQQLYDQQEHSGRESPKLHSPVVPTVYGYRQDTHTFIRSVSPAGEENLRPSSIEQAHKQFPSLSGIIRLGENAPGQILPPGLRPKVKTEAWPDEKTLYVAVEASDQFLIRRVDNNLINGTKLLNYTGISRGRRDGILKQEKVRHVVRMGNQNLKGVWIPFERAYEIAKEHNVVDSLYPLFLADLETFLYGPNNVTRTQQVVCRAQQTNETFGSWMWSKPPHSQLSPLMKPGNAKTRAEEEVSTGYHGGVTQPAGVPDQYLAERSTAVSFETRYYGRTPTNLSQPMMPSHGRRMSERGIPHMHRRQYSIEKSRMHTSQQTGIEWQSRPHPVPQFALAGPPENAILIPSSSAAPATVGLGISGEYVHQHHPGFQFPQRRTDAPQRGRSQSPYRQAEYTQVHGAAVPQASPLPPASTPTPSPATVAAAAAAAAAAAQQQHHEQYNLGYREQSGPSPEQDNPES